jgi:hypothetical protein
LRIQYRVRQFWRTLAVKNDRHELEQALALLNPAQRVLFTQMQPSEQNHALMIFHCLLEQGDNQPDLLVAALLHDVGKLRYRLKPLGRVMVVLVKTVMPEQARRWGALPPNGCDGLLAWRKVFIVAEHHSEWGAEMTRQAGVSPLTENLIRFHDRPHRQDADAEESSLLDKLRLFDNES